MRDRRLRASVFVMTQEENFPAMSGYGPGDYTRTRKPRDGARKLTAEEVAAEDAVAQQEPPAPGVIGA